MISLLPDNIYPMIPFCKFKFFQGSVATIPVSPWRGFTLPLVETHRIKIATGSQRKERIKPLKTPPSNEQENIRLWTGAGQDSYTECHCLLHLPAVIKAHTHPSHWTPPRPWRQDDMHQTTHLDYIGTKIRALEELDPGLQIYKQKKVSTSWQWLFSNRLMSCHPDSSSSRNLQNVDQKLKHRTRTKRGIEGEKKRRSKPNKKNRESLPPTPIRTNKSIK